MVASLNRSANEFDAVWSELSLLSVSVLVLLVVLILVLVLSVPVDVRSCSKWSSGSVEEELLSSELLVPPMPPP